MRINPILIVAVVVIVLVAILYIFALNSNVKPSNAIKKGSFATYSFNVQPSGTNGTYRWEIISVTDSTAIVLEQISVNSTAFNYTSYLNLDAGVITRERVTANGTLREPLCFMVTDPEKIAQCPYYSPLRIERKEVSFGRNAVRVVPENSTFEYMIFDKQTGIILKAQYGMNEIASVYELTSTNVF